MAIQELTAGAGYVVQPFQGHASLTTSFVAATQTNISFTNDGYCVLFVQNNSGGNRLVKISSEPDNAGRIDEDLSTTGFNVPTMTTEMFGPFRPIWWNEAGKVFIELDATATTNLVVVKYQF
jgi:hypothetical protein